MTYNVSSGTLNPTVQYIVTFVTLLAVLQYNGCMKLSE